MAKPPRPTAGGEKGGIHTLSGDLRAPFRDLPELEGTPRQIEWANDLRKKFFDSVEETVLPVYEDGRLMGSWQIELLGQSAKDVKAQLDAKAEKISKGDAARKARLSELYLKEYEKAYQS